MIFQNLFTEILQANSVNAILISENFYKSLLAVVPGGLSIATDASCEKILHNRRAAQFLRIKEFETFSHSAIQPPSVKVFSEGKELVPNEMPMQLAANNNELITSFELEFVWEDGVRKTAIWTASPIHMDNGNVAGVIASFEEITEQKQVQEKLHRIEIKK